MENRSVVMINAITVPPERADELAARFAARAGEVGKADGFEEFQLLRPTDDRNTWLVYTRWRDEEAFQAWVNSPAFSHGHRQSRPPEGSETAPSAEAAPSGQGGQPAGGHGHGQGHGAGGGPVATSSELWSFAVIQREAKA